MRPRVAQWATGNIGTRALRRIIEHPGLELAGLYVHGGAKAGHDAGEIAGTAPTGIRATNHRGDIIALRPDCVVYMPRETCLDDVCALLEAGINIVTTRGEFCHPPSMAPEARARVEAACRAGRSSIHATGISPGFKTETVPLLLTSLQRRLDFLSIAEFSDVSSRNSPEMLFDIMGFGAPPGPVPQARLNAMRESFGPSMAVVADAVGLPFDDVTAAGQLGMARNDTPIAAGLVRAGTVAAMRSVVSGWRGGAVLMEFSATWYVTPDIIGAEDWKFRGGGWHVSLRGDVPLEFSVAYGATGAAYAEMTPSLTAHGPVNAIPYVCAAAPGIVTTADLPPIIPQLG